MSEVLHHALVIGTGEWATITMGEVALPWGNHIGTRTERAFIMDAVEQFQGGEGHAFWAERLVGGTVHGGWTWLLVKGHIKMPEVVPCVQLTNRLHSHDSSLMQAGDKK